MTDRMTVSHASDRKRDGWEVSIRLGQEEVTGDLSKIILSDVLWKDRSLVQRLKGSWRRGDSKCRHLSLAVSSRLSNLKFPQGSQIPKWVTPKYLMFITYRSIIKLALVLVKEIYRLCKKLFVRQNLFKELAFTEKMILQSIPPFLVEVG